MPLLIAVAAGSPMPFPPFEAGFVAALGPVRGKAGSWAEYLVRTRGEQDLRVRLALLPPVLEGGRSWLEVTALGALALPFAARLLVDPEGGVERVLIYALGQAPIELTAAGRRAASPASKRTATAGRTVRLGSASVVVPAGSFHAEELRVIAAGQATRVWRAPEVPLWGLLRSEGPRQTVELTACGDHGARSVFPDAQGNGSESAK